MNRRDLFKSTVAIPLAAIGIKGTISSEQSLMPIASLGGVFVAEYWHDGVLMATSKVENSVTNEGLDEILVCGGQNE